MNLLFDGRVILETILPQITAISVQTVALHGDKEGRDVLHFAVELPHETWLTLQAQALRDDLSDD